MRVRVEFNTTEFEFSHGRKPRPSQFGCWVFECCGTFKEFNGTFKSVQTQVKEWARTFTSPTQAVVTVKVGA